jgi:pimeloyl-ACP methyl ester carboxylesterase
MEFLPNTEKQLQILGSKVHIYFFKFNPKNPYMLMLHGLSADTNRMIGLIRELEGKFNVVSLDLPGFGRSREFETEENYIEYTSRFLSNLLDKLDIPKKELVLFGASNGANILINYLINHKSEELKKVILFAPIYSHKNLSMSKGYRLFVKWITLKSANGGIVSKSLQRIMDSGTLFDMFALIFDKDARKDREILEYQKNLWKLQSIKHWGKTLKDSLNVDYSDNNILIEDHNIIFIYPKSDQYLDVESTVINFKKMFPNSRILYYESVKHMPRKDFMSDPVVGPSIRRVIKEISKE